MSKQLRHRQQYGGYEGRAGGAVKGSDNGDGRSDFGGKGAMQHTDDVYRTGHLRPILFY